MGERPDDFKQGRGRDRAAVAASVALHALLAVLLLPWWTEPPLPLSEAGGSGWASEIDLAAARAARDGAQGDGDEADPARHRLRGERPERLEVQMVFLPKAAPKLPAPELALKLAPVPPPVESDMLPPREKPREPVERVEDKAERRTETAEASEAAASEAGAARTADEASRGGKGARDEASGSPAGTAAAGAGAGHSDRQRPQGDYLTGARIASLLQGWTLVGTEGGYDGSTGAATDTRFSFRWEAYYGPDGEVEVRFEAYGALVPHGEIAVRRYADSGRWTIQGDLLCQQIDDVGYGMPVCFEVHHKDGNKVAMYYAECGGLTRCYRGRLGPEGVVVPGRQFSM